MRILFIENNIELTEIIKKGLCKEGYCVDVARDGEEGLYMIENFPADVVLLDIMLPKMDGLSVLNKMRQKGIDTPVLVLSARDTVSDKIKGLDSGADDYLTKPFDFMELLARIRVLIRRKSEAKEAVIRIADIEINIASHEVRKANRLIPLSAKEYAILEYLAYKKDTVISRTEIIEHVYQEHDLDSNIIDVYINYLRNKIDRGSRRELLHTVRGVGYMLKDKEE